MVVPAAHLVECLQRCVGVHRYEAAGTGTNCSSGSHIWIQLQGLTASSLATRRRKPVGEAATGMLWQDGKASFSGVPGYGGSVSVCVCVQVSHVSLHVGESGLGACQQYTLCCG